MRLLLVLALLLVAGTARAQAADAGAGESAYGCVESVPKGAQRPLVTDVFPPRGTSGWAATLSITVRHGKGERVLPSGLDLSSAVEAKKVLKQAGFTIPDQDGGAGAQIWSEPDDEKSATAVTHLELPVVLLPEKPGRNVMSIPPLPVAVARANGEIATVCTHPHVVLVEDPIASTPNAQPAMNPPGLPQREEWTALKKGLLWGSLGLLAGAILALLIRRKMNQPKPVPPPPPPRPPWELALEELDEVRHAGLLETERYSEYFDRTSDALRRYLGSRFGFDGLESTTDEILAALRKQGAGFIRLEPATPGAFGFAPGIGIEKIAGFLRDCDLVKFANLTPSPEQCAISLTSGEAIVRGTMPMSMGGVVEPAVIADPVAAAQLRSPVASTPPRPERSPYEPPDEPDAPVADAPVADAPVADAPVADAPVADAPVADAPVADAPVADAVEAPKPPDEPGGSS